MSNDWVFDAHIRMPDDPALLAALRSYASPSCGNLRQPERCKPGADETPEQRDMLKGSVGKIVFAGKREAEGFCRSISVVDHDKLEPYYCERGHWHVRNIVKNRNTQGWRYHDRPE